MNINEYIKRKSGKAHAPQMTPEEAVAKYAGMASPAHTRTERTHARAHQPIEKVSEVEIWI